MKTLILTGLAAVLAAGPAFAQTTVTKTIDTPRAEGSRTTIVDPTTGTATRDASVTRKRDGATATRSAERTRTDTGVTASATGTNFAGETRSAQYERTRTENGYTASGSATGRGGRTFTSSADAARTENSYTRNRSVQNPAGETVYSRDVTGSRADGTVSRNVSTTRAENFKPRANRSRPVRSPRARRHR